MGCIIAKRGTKIHKAQPIEILDEEEYNNDPGHAEKIVCEVSNQKSILYYRFICLRNNTNHASSSV
jgi:hypothetical protein